MAEVVNGTLRLLGDRIVVKPMEWDASKIVIAIRHGRPVRGRIMAVGPGCNPKKYRKDVQGNRKSFEYSRHFRPTEVKVGDVVELGGLNIFDGKGYQFDEIILNGEHCLICSEKDVAVVRDDQHSETESQGHERRIA